MARVCRFLTYMPAASMGLLVVAWLVSHFLSLGVYGHAFSSRLWLEKGDATVVWSLDYPFLAEPTLYCQRTEGQSAWLGLFSIELAGDLRWIRIPLIALITAILPLAIGPFIRFRFRIWHYLAYTALVAAECAYYLRVPVD